MPRPKGFVLGVRACKDCKISLPISEFKPKDGIPQLWICRGCRAKELRMRRMVKKGKEVVAEKVRIYQSQMRESESDVGVNDSHSQTAPKEEVIIDCYPTEKIVVDTPVNEVEEVEQIDNVDHSRLIDNVDQNDFLSRLKKKKKKN